jgi:phage tail sheath protein FI
MPSTYTYPGVYIEEIPSGVHTITGVSTSDTAFVDFFKRGPLNKPVRITSYSDFERRFGGLDARSKASYAIQQYYLNGGQVAWVVRIATGAETAVLELEGGSPTTVVMTLEAASPGLWGKNVQVAVGSVAGSSDLFNLAIREVASVGGRAQVVGNEIHRNLSMSAQSPRYAKDVLDQESSLVNARSVVVDGDIPTPSGGDVTGAAVIADPTSSAFAALSDDPDLSAPAVSDGSVPTDSATWSAGINTLDGIAPFIFNILCLPAVAEISAIVSTVYAAAAAYCEAKRAFLIVDIPDTVATLDQMTQWMTNVGDSLRHSNAAVYFPRFEIADRLNEDRPRNVAASGTVAGIYARTDSARGVWKAPAGTDATLRGVTVKTRLTDLENGGLNQMGVNVLRTFPVYGNICWGARTMNGADQQASEWKYVPVRRTALYIEESLYQGLKWAVFEPNDEPLWAQLRLNVGAFMHTLFRQGAFQGSTPREAYLVKCDKETTTQDDVNRGIVNILVGFAPLKPAEFVVVRIQQLAGQIQT